MRIVVVFPAPFFPIKPKIECSCTMQLRFSRIISLRKVFFIFRTCKISISHHIFLQLQLMACIVFLAISLNFPMDNGEILGGKIYAQLAVNLLNFGFRSGRYITNQLIYRNLKIRSKQR